MIRIFKRTIYNNLNRVYLGLPYKKSICLPLNNKNIKVKIPKYLDLTLEELIQNKKDINKMHRLVYKKKNI